MLRLSIHSASALLLGATAFAQVNLSRQFRPITVPIQNAGVYHLASGTWTLPLQGGQQGAGLGGQPTAAPGIIYDNTCAVASYALMASGARFFDEGRLPSTSSTVVANTNNLGNDSEVGTQDAYTVDAFQFGYCTKETTHPTYVINFYQAFDACAATPATPTASFGVNGLPGSLTAGTLACYTVVIDLTNCSPGGTPLSFNMQADADGAYGGLAQGLGDTFGWSFQLTSASPHAGDGIFIAGGKPTAAGGSYTVCSGSDGTVFDSGTISSRYPDNSDAINLGVAAFPCTTFAAGATPELGTGMGTQDMFREENNPPTANGCYTWPGTLMGSYYLQLYSANVELPPPANPAVAFCDPGVAGVIACPCGNPPLGAGRGCNNSENTGGAALVGSGSASLANDTLVFVTSGQRAVNISLVLQGLTSLSAGAPFGQGVRCFTGSLKRLYAKPAVLGSITAPGPLDQSIHDRSATLGEVIAPGTHRFYCVYYRDGTVLGGCASSLKFNATNAADVLWH